MENHSSSALLNFDLSSEKTPASAELPNNSLIAENLPVGVYQTNADGSAVYVNQRCYEISGQKPGTVLGHEFMQIPHPDDLPRVLDECRRATAECRDYSIEYRIVHPSGEIRWVKIKGGALRSPDGKCAGHIGIILDITERKTAQETLSLFRELIDGTSDGIEVIESQTGRFLDVNQTTCAQLGYTREEMIRLTVFDVAPSATPESYRGNKKEMRAAGSIVLETVHRRKDGSTFPVEVNLRMVKLDREYHVAVVRDITERKKAERALAEANLLNNQIIASVQDGLHVVDRDHRYRVWNPKMEEMTGFKAADVLGKRTEDLFPYLGELGVFDTLERAMGGEVVSIDIPDRNAVPGQIAWRSSLKSPLRSPTGEIIGVITTLRDVTERKKAQEAIILSEKMLSVGGLAAGMAHEINNPLAAMMQNGQIALSRLDPNSPTNQAAAARCGTTIEAINAYMRAREITDMLAAIHNSGERAAAIVRNMLQFSRPGSASKEKVRLNQLIDQAVELIWSDYDLKKRFDRSNVHVVRQYDSSLDKIRCHPAEVQQVFFNLFKNSIQAAATEMNRIQPLRIVIRTRQEEDHVRIEIADNGPGMPENIRRRVFEPFFTTKGPGEGTGLGLSVSYFIITRHHGGTMFVESAPDGGTCFQIGLPK
jgi:PAS domain S-box-containing protein